MDSCLFSEYTLSRRVYYSETIYTDECCTENRNQTHLAGTVIVSVLVVWKAAEPIATPMTSMVTATPNMVGIADRLVFVSFAFR